MAKVYEIGKGVTNNVAASVGDKYWWYMHDRRLLTIRVEGNTLRGEVHLAWSHYIGLCTKGEDISGEVVWSAKEWDSANLIRHKEPVRESDLGPDEEICHSCSGLYFEVERDFDVLACIWCKGSGKQKKREEPKQPTRRSLLHPELPPE